MNRAKGGPPSAFEMSVSWTKNWGQTLDTKTRSGGQFLTQFSEPLSRVSGRGCRRGRDGVSKKSGSALTQVSGSRIQKLGHHYIFPKKLL